MENKSAKINRFVNHEFRYKEFERMLQSISAKTRTSPELIRKYTQRAMDEWEKDTGLNVLNLFVKTRAMRSREILKILDHFRDHLRPIVFSKRKLDEAINIAYTSLENMYHIF